jgi:WD40 repeat protein
MKRYWFCFLCLFCFLLIPTMAQSELAACEGLQETRLNGGMYARVLRDIPVYEQPSTSSPVIDTVTTGTQVFITSAPVCAENIVWWQAMYRPVAGPEDFPFGYLGEGENGYDLEPVLQTIELPSPRTEINGATILNMAQVAQVEFGMIYQSTWSPDGKYWMINTVGANWLYDVSAIPSSPLRFSQNAYDTNATHGMTIRDSEFIMVGSVSPVTMSQQFGVSSFSLADGLALDAATLLTGDYSSLAAMTADGTLAAAANWNGDIFLYDLSNGSQIHTLSGHSLVGGMQFSPDGRYLVSWGGSGMMVSDTTIRVWDIGARGQIGVLELGDNGLSSVVGFMPDSSQVVVKPPSQARLDFYEPNMALVSSIELPATQLSSFAFSPDASLIALAVLQGDGGAAPYEHTVQFYDRASNSIVRVIPMPSFIKTVSFSPDNSLFSIVFEDPEFWGPNRASLWAVVEAQ